MKELLSPLAHRAVQGFALAGVTLAFTGAQDAHAAKGNRTIFNEQGLTNVYSDANSNSILTQIQYDLAPSGLPADLPPVLTVAHLAPGKLTVEADCQKGSLFSALTESYNAVREAKCDGSVTEMPAGLPESDYLSGDTPLPKYQAELKTIGSQLIRSVPGMTVNLKQEGTELNVTAAGIDEAFTCPQPYAPQKYPNVKTISISPANKANVTFCPTTELVSMLPVDTTSAKFAPAFNRYITDPIRNKLFGGDEYNHNVYQLCPEKNGAVAYPPYMKLRYSKSKGVKASFYGVQPDRYCDEVGQYSSEVSVQLAKAPKKPYKQVGGKVLHVSGLKEILVHNDPVTFFSNNELKVSANVPDTKVVCTSTMSRSMARLKIVQRFAGAQVQYFQHPDGGSAASPVPSVSKTFFSKPIAVCK